MALRITNEASRCLQCKKPMCTEGCPAHTPIPKVIALFKENQLMEAGRVLFENNPMSLVCSMVCDHMAQCAGHCVLGRKGQPVHFYEIENYISDARVQLVRDRTDEQALFVNQYGRRITRQGLWKILKDYGEKAQLEHSLTPHTLRNSFAVHMLQNGADLKSLQELMGHDDITATQVYLSATKSRLKDVYDRAHPRA